MKLKLEINPDLVKDKTEKLNIGNTQILITPPIGEDYWLYRVKLYKSQAIIGFPKFCQIGIGFALEDDWNTNLPSTCTATKIFRHIRRNKKYKYISDNDCISAIKLIQKAVKRFGTVE
jgi:hypothetical protein